MALQSDLHHRLINATKNIGAQNASVNVSLTDGTGRTAFTTTFGQIATSHKDSQITEQFAYGLPSSGVENGTTGSGSVVPGDSMLKLKTTTADGTAYIESLQAIRYIPGSMAYAFFTAYGMPVGESCDAFIGIFDNEDGFAIGVLDGVPNVLRRRYNGVSADDYYVAQSEWNLDTLDGNGRSKLNVDFTQGQVYTINYGYLGFAPIVFSIMAPDNKWVPFHIIEYPNNYTETNISMPYLPLRAEVDNTGSGYAVEVGFGSVDAGIYNGGKTDSASRYTALNCGDLLATPKTFTSLDYVIAIRGKQTLGGRINRISSLFKGISWATQDSIKSVTSDLIKDPDVTVDGTWTSLGDDSPLEYSIDTTFDLTSGTATGLGAALAKDSTRAPGDVSQIAEVLCRRGETLVVRCNSTNGVISDMFISMQDLF